MQLQPWAVGRSRLFAEARELFCLQKLALLPEVRCAVVSVLETRDMLFLSSALLRGAAFFPRTTLVILVCGTSEIKRRNLNMRYCSPNKLPAVDAGEPSGIGHTAGHQGDTTECFSDTAGHEAN